MDKILPKDLREAESQLFNSTQKVIDSLSISRISIQIKFEGLKVEPIVLRFAMKLLLNERKFNILFSDFGSAALFKRDNPDLKDYIFTFKDINNSTLQISDSILLLAVAPQPYNYDEFYEMCSSVSSKIIMFNGKLEDNAVGIGSVGRDRRSSFIKSWKPSYYLAPLENGAILFDFFNQWQLFSYSNEGYRFIKSFDQRPDELLINSYLYS